MSQRLNAADLLQVRGQGFHFGFIQVDEQAFGDHQHLVGGGAQLREQGAAGLPVRQVQGVAFQAAEAFRVLQGFALVFDHGGQVHLHPAQLRGQCEPVRPRVEAGGEIQHRVEAILLHGLKDLLVQHLGAHHDGPTGHADLPLDLRTAFAGQLPGVGVVE